MNYCRFIYFVAGAGAYAGCCYCCVEGEYCHCLSMMVYLGHRQFLSPSDPLNRDIGIFQERSNSTTKLKTIKYIDEANGKYAATTTNAERLPLQQDTGCKGLYALRRLPGHDRLLNTPVDPMHLIKNVAEHIVRLVSGTEDSH